MGDKMIEVLRLVGFSLDAKGRWIIELNEHNEVVKYWAREETDYPWERQIVLVYRIYVDDEEGECIDDSEGFDFTQFVMFNFE